MTPSPGLFPAIFFLSRAARGSWNNHHDRMMLTAIANRVTQVGIAPGQASWCYMGSRHTARLAATAAARGAAHGRTSRAGIWHSWAVYAVLHLRGRHCVLEATLSAVWTQLADAA